mgnify:CR=1 FL=1
MMEPSARIRLAGPEDRGAVEAIVQAAYAPYILRIGRKPGPMLDDYGALIVDERVSVLVDRQEIRGLVVLIPDGEALLLDNVAVDPRAQGCGYGRMLLAFAEAEARRMGARALRLYTNEAMTENLALYGRLGFVETHRAVEEGLRRVYMTKVLES